MMKREEVRWCDPCDLFQKHSVSLQSLHVSAGLKPSLKPLYQDLEDVFLTCAHVQNKPDMGDYMKLLVHITEVPGLPRSHHDVLTVLSVLGDELRAAQDTSAAEESNYRKSLKTQAAKMHSKVSPTTTSASKPRLPKCTTRFTFI